MVRDLISISVCFDMTLFIIWFGMPIYVFFLKIYLFGVNIKYTFFHLLISFAFGLYVDVVYSYTFFTKLEDLPIPFGWKKRTLYYLRVNLFFIRVKYEFLFLFNLFLIYHIRFNLPVWYPSVRFKNKFKLHRDDE